jgi:hypothetical protein
VNDLHLSRWAPTKRSLHMYAQMLGKIRLALSPAQPNWMFTPLSLSARGLTTGPMPYGESSVQASLDFFASRITIERSNGAERSLGLQPARTVAEVYHEISAALAQLDIACVISPIPQEVADITPMDCDRRPSEYDPAAVLRWFDAVTAIAGIFDSWRAPFFGRSAIQLWWGAFDIALLLFSGKRVPPPTDRGYLMRYDLDAELMNVGFYLGDEKQAPFFYGYIYPQPGGVESLPIAPASVSWSPELREWVLPYDDVRLSEDPGGVLRTFLDSVFEHCFDVAGWSRDSVTYEMPKRKAALV